MTIKQLADQLGVTKDQVRYRVRKMGVESVELIDGVYHLSTDAVNEITQYFIGNSAGNYTDLHTESTPRISTPAPESQRIIDLEKENAELKAKLSVLEAQNGRLLDVLEKGYFNMAESFKMALATPESVNFLEGAEEDEKDDGKADPDPGEPVSEAVVADKLPRRPKLGIRARLRAARLRR